MTNSKANMKLIGAAVLMLIFLLLGVILLTQNLEKGQNQVDEKISVEGILSNQDGTSDPLFSPTITTIPPISDEVSV